MISGCGSDPLDPGEDPNPWECAVDCGALETSPCMKSVCNDGSLPGPIGACAEVPLDDGTSCNAGDLCIVGGTCQAGVCTGGEPMDCSELDGACAVGACDPSDGTCKPTPVNEGASCDRGLCLVDGVCAAGECVGDDEVDCSELDSACTVGVCNPADGSCVAEPANEGASCDDGDLCTVGSVCAEGLCGGGAPVDCSEFDSACMVGRCDPTDGSCVAEPVVDGTRCDDGDACTLEDVCVEGVCTSGAPMDCSRMDSACTVGVCDPDSGSCQAEPVEDGTACEGGNRCMVGSTCQEGVCAGGEPVDCSSLDGDCVEGVCDPATGACTTTAANPGAPCDDGDLCTVNDACMFGVCVGMPNVQCGHLDSECLVGACDPATGACTTVPVIDGTPCDDGNICTTGGVCMAGVCSDGPPIDCSSLDSACTMGVCDPTDGGCVTVAANEGAACDDGLACTSGTVCMDGVCAGGTAPACSQTPDGCCPESCNEQNDADCACPGTLLGGTCVYIPDTGTVADQNAARAACAALGAGWGLCDASFACMPDVSTYLVDAGCDCNGGAAACACGTSRNLYIHVEGPLSPYYTRGPSFPGCLTSEYCTDSVSESCGTPLCCK